MVYAVCCIAYHLRTIHVGFKTACNNLLNLDGMRLIADLVNVDVIDEVEPGHCMGV
jgi:hypothetical protein